MDNASKLLELARQKFGDLTEAEKKLFKAVANGDDAVFSSEDQKQNDPAGSSKWDKERNILASRVVWLCIDKELSDLVTNNGIQIEGARIDGPLEMSFSDIGFPIGFWGCDILGTISLQYAKTASIALTGSRVKAIEADGINIDGCLLLKDGFRSLNGIRLSGATIKGNLECDNSRIIGKNIKKRVMTEEKEKRMALVANGLKVGGNVFLRYGFKAQGTVDFAGASITGELDCDGGTFCNKGSSAISAGGLKVENGLSMSNGFSAEGHIDLINAEIGGIFDWVNVASPEWIELDLRSAKLEAILDECNSWPSDGNLYLHGLVYDHFVETGSVDTKSRLEWIRRQPQDQYRPQPYEQLASVFRKEGREDDAKKVMIEKNRDEIKLGKLPFLTKLWRRILGVSIGFGYRPMRALWIGITIIGLGCAIFYMGYEADVMLRTRQIGSESAGYRPTRAMLAGYPAFNALWYSIDMFVPLMDLHQAKYWLPNAKKSGKYNIFKTHHIPINGNFLNWYMCIHIILGWIVSTLFAVGLTGKLRS